MVDPTPKFESAGSMAPDNLLTGDFPIVTDEVTIAAGAGQLQRGAVLGKITASGKYILSLAAAADGSQTPDAILAQAVDASAADRKATAYIAGSFQARGLVFGAGHTAASTKAGLRTKSIFVRASAA